MRFNLEHGRRPLNCVRVSRFALDLSTLETIAGPHTILRSKTRCDKQQAERIVSAPLVVSHVQIPNQLSINFQSTFNTLHGVLNSLRSSSDPACKPDAAHAHRPGRSHTSFACTSSGRRHFRCFHRPALRPRRSWRHTSASSANAGTAARFEPPCFQTLRFQALRSGLPLQAGLAALRFDSRDSCRHPFVIMRRCAAVRCRALTRRRPAKRGAKRSARP